MARTFCLTADQIKILRDGMKAVGGKKLTNMSFAELEALFYTSTNNEKAAVEMAKSFKLAVISTKKKALHNWLVQNLSTDEVKHYEREVPVEKMAILSDYKKRMAEIKDSYKQGKIDKEQKDKQAKKEASLVDEKLRTIPTKQEKVLKNIERLQKKLEAIREGTYEKPARGQKREYTQEEKDLQEQIDVEFRRIDTEVYADMDKDVIERALGVQENDEVVTGINLLNKKLFEASKLEPDNPFTGYHSSYFEIQRQMHTYLDTIQAMDSAEIVSSTILRGMLLFSVKSPVLNIVSNAVTGAGERTVEGIYQGIAGVATGKKVRFSGVVDTSGYISFASKTYATTGVDVVRAMSADSARKVLGERFKMVGSNEEDSSAIRNAVLATGRWTQKWVFQYGQGLADVGFAANHFATKANIEATKMADARGLTGDEHRAYAEKLFFEATSLRLDENDPAHTEAIFVKREALAYALKATFQNDGQYSKALMDIRNQIDTYTGSLHLGTNIVAPFIKTVANLAMISSEYTGLTLPMTAVRTVNAVRQGDVETLRESGRVAIRAGIGVAIAILIAALLDDDDYMPDYMTANQNQRDLQKAQGIPYNSIRIGDKYVSLAYFGTFGWALAGVLSAKQSQSAGGAGVQYGLNTFLQLRQTPVISYFFDMADYVADIYKYRKTAKDITDDAVAFAANFAMSHTIPAIVSDTAKGIDEYDRLVDYRQPASDVLWDTFKSKIPFWREVLPVKYNTLGDPRMTENFVLTLLAGSRLKTAPTDSTLYAELVRLSISGENVKLSFEDIGDIKILHTLLDKYEYNDFYASLQKGLANGLANTMDKEVYKRADDEKKKAMMMDVRDGLVKKKLREFGYYSRVQEEKRRIKNDKD